MYGLFYLPIELHHSLLAETHHFDDSKVLTPEVRTDLMRKLCTKGSDLYEAGGWATRVMSALKTSQRTCYLPTYTISTPKQWMPP